MVRNEGERVVMMFLSKDELVQLTGRRRPKAQARALTRMGIPHRRRPDGSPVVLRIHLDMPDASVNGDKLAGEGRPLEPVLQP